ncbi:RICIN domain-containing protein [Streptomyces sp. NPDC001941]|uniref:RICIN domain-containing protein n=1 Tax=Streptomyces sp. NPDC001941 TaxID=3154659 RepID=UPI0033281DFB
MKRATRVLAGAAATVFAVAAAPAVAATTGTAAAAPQPTVGQSLERFSAQEARDLESRYPVQAARLKQAVALSAGDRGAARAAGTTAVDPGAETGGYYKIRNLNSDKCLAIGNGKTANGAVAIQWDCLDIADQVWWVGGNNIVNFNSGKYLAIGGGNTANGAKAIQWEHTGGNEQAWYGHTDGHILNWNSDKFLAIGASSTANGAKAVQWEYTGSNGQYWY